MEFITIYEYTPEANNLFQVIPLFIFFLLGIGIVFFFKNYIKTYSFFRQLFVFFGYLIGIIASIMIVVTLISIPKIISEEKQFQNVIRQKSYKVVEGEIEQFSNYNESGHVFEKFTIKGVGFEYSDYILGKGFNKTSKNNGPILKIYKEGRKVRISYVRQDNDNMILKIEVEQKEE